MKRVTASDARKNWFRILDEVAAGEVVCIERDGRRIVLRCEVAEDDRSAAVPDYSDLITAPSAADAERWGWAWDDSDGGLRPMTGDAEE